MENYSVNVNLKKEDVDRISRLCGRLGQFPEDIVRVALMFFEEAVDAVEAVDGSLCRIVGMGVEVKKDG